MMRGQNRLLKQQMIVKKEEAVIKKASKAIKVTGKIKGAFKKILNKKQR